MIDKRSKIFLGIFTIIVLISIVMTYSRYVINKDFVVFTDEITFNDYLLEE
jgi:hypothetical protein